MAKKRPRKEEVEEQKTRDDKVRSEEINKENQVL